MRQGAVTPRQTGRREVEKKEEEEMPRAWSEKKTRKRAREKENERDCGMPCGSPALQGPSFVRNEAPSQRSPLSSPMRSRRCVS